MQLDGRSMHLDVVSACLPLQAFALVGCLVTGTLARRRRLEVEGLNGRLRQINAELLKRGTVEVSSLPLTVPGH